MQVLKIGTRQDSAAARKKAFPNCRRSSSFKINAVERRLIGSAKTKVDAQFELVFAELRTWSIRAMSVVADKTPRRSNFTTQVRVGFSLTREGVALCWIWAVVAISPNLSLATSRIASHGVGCNRFFLWHIWSPFTQDCQQAHSSELLVLVRYPSLHHGAKELSSIYGVLHDVERPYYATNPRCLVFTWWCLDRRCPSWSKSVHTQRGELGGRGFDDGNDLTCS